MADLPEDIPRPWNRRNAIDFGDGTSDISEYELTSSSQSSSTVSPPSSVMRGPRSFDRKLEEMKPSKR